MRSFSLVLLRRLLFRAPLNQRVPLYDVLSAQILSTIERLLLHSLAHEPSLAVRHKAVDTVSDLANNSMSRGRPWHALQSQAFAMAEDEHPASRESAFRVFAGSPNLIMDLQPETVVRLLQKGLEDPSNVEVSAGISLILLSGFELFEAVKSRHDLSASLHTSTWAYGSQSLHGKGRH